MQDAGPQKTLFLCKCNHERCDQEVVSTAVRSMPGITAVHTGEFYCGDAGREILREAAAGSREQEITIVLSCRKEADWFEDAIDDGCPLFHVVNVKESILSSENSEGATRSIIERIRRSLR